VSEGKLLAHTDRHPDIMRSSLAIEPRSDLWTQFSEMMTRFVDWFWRDRHTGRIVIAQWPNIWLWIFPIASVVELNTNTAEPAGISVHIVATAFLAIWAGDELLRGVNPWRRCLGIAVLIVLTTKLIA